MSIGEINLYTRHAFDIFMHLSLHCMALGSKILHYKEIMKPYEVQSKLWPLKNHYMFNSTRDNLKILKFKILFASLCGIAFNIY